MKHQKRRLLLVILSCVVSNWTQAATPVANTPAEETYYEQPRQGWIKVNAVLFSAPCNLAMNTDVILTECGAGVIFHENDIPDSSVKTPVKLQFYDVLQGQKFKRSAAQLTHGNNKIPLPILNENQHILRLEVSYE